MLLGSEASSKGRVYRTRLQMRLEEDRSKTINRYEIDVLRVYVVITRQISEEGEEHETNKIKNTSRLRNKKSLAYFTAS
jgi:hypothetical protein